jgi:hypothetical protein
MKKRTEGENEMEATAKNILKGAPARIGAIILVALLLATTVGAAAYGEGSYPAKRHKVTGHNFQNGDVFGDDENVATFVADIEEIELEAESDPLMDVTLNFPPTVEIKQVKLNEEDVTEAWLATYSNVEGSASVNKRTVFADKTALTVVFEVPDGMDLTYSGDSLWSNTESGEVTYGSFGFGLGEGQKHHPDYTLIGKSLTKVDLADVRNWDEPGADPRVLKHYGNPKGDIYRLDVRKDFAEWPLITEHYRFILYNRASIAEKKGEFLSSGCNAVGYSFGLEWYGDFFSTGMGDFEDNEEGESIGLQMNGNEITRDAAGTQRYVEYSFWIDVPAGSVVAISDSTKNDPYNTDMIVTAPPVVEVVSDGGAKYVIGGGSPLVVKSSRSMSGEGFSGLWVDGKELTLAKTSATLWEGKEAKVEEGSTVATLYAAYLDTLPAGDHSITLAYADGNNATIAFKVLAGSPQTGDEAPLAFFMLVLVASALLGAAAAARLRKMRGGAQRT